MLTRSHQQVHGQPQLHRRPVTRVLLIAGALSLGVSASVSSRAQIPNTAPPPRPVQPSAAPELRRNDPPPAAPSAPTFKAQTRRVVVDVVVTDPQGHPITGLTKNDFSVLENNTPQPMRSFEVHTVAAQTPYVAPRLPKLPTNTFINLATAPESGTPTVILYDVLNTPQSAQSYAHEEIVHYIKHRRPGTQVAIFVLGDKLHLIQGFTEDTELLAKALDGKKGGPQVASTLGPVASTTTFSDQAPNPTQTTPAGAGTTAQIPGANPAPSDTEQETLDQLANAEALESSYLLDRRVDITLDALTGIGRFLASLPGRKNLIWLSASFPAGILPDSTINAGSAQHDQGIRNYSEEMKEATDLLNVSHVAVYPVDVRGVTVNAAFSAASNTAFGSNASSFSKSVQNFSTTQGEEHSTMNSIAESTGGRAFYGTNDLQEAVDNAMLNGSTYYSLTYAPTNPNFDGSLRKITIKMQKAGYTLSYRKSYFADDLEAAAQAVQDAPQSPLTPSLEHGTPLAHELLVSAHLEAVGEPVPASPKQMELLMQYEAMRDRRKRKRSKTPPAPLPAVLMQQYVVQYGLIARQLDLPETATGAHEASLEFGIISYDSEGRKLNGIDTKVDDSIPPPRYAKLADAGYHVIQTVVIPVTATSVRLAVRDAKANHIGSIEVPLPLVRAEAKPVAMQQPDEKVNN